VPSKTFHFGPDFEKVLIDLFEDHLALTALLEASTGIVAAPRPDTRQVSAAILRADRDWVAVINEYWPTKKSVYLVE